MVFKKDLMLKRLVKTGDIKLLDEETIDIMFMLDGREVNEQTWNNKVIDTEPRYIINVDGTNYPINSEDCE